MEKGGTSQYLIDFLTDNQLKWEPFHEQYETVVIDKSGNQDIE